MKKRSIKLKFFSIDDFYNFINEFIKLKYSNFKIELYKKVNSKFIESEINFDKNDLFLNTIKEEIKNSELTGIKINFDQYKLNFSINKENDNTIITTLFILDDIRPYIIDGYPFKLPDLYSIARKNNGSIYFNEIQSLQKQKWIPIEEWEDFPVKIKKEKSELIIENFNLKIIFRSYEDFYYFINEFINYLQIERDFVEVIYEWDEEERRDFNRVNLESKEKFIESLVISHFYKFYDERIIIKIKNEFVIYFSYSYNLGYRNITYFDSNKGKYEREEIFLGIPTKVEFTTSFEIDEEKNILFANKKIPLQFFKDLIDKLNSD